MNEPSPAAKQAADEFRKWHQEVGRPDNYYISFERLVQRFQAAIDQVLAEQAASTAEDVQDMMRDGEHIADLVKQLKERDEEIATLKDALGFTNELLANRDEAYVKLSKQITDLTSELAVAKPFEQLWKRRGE